MRDGKYRQERTCAKEYNLFNARTKLRHCAQERKGGILHTKQKKKKLEASGGGRKHWETEETQLLKNRKRRGAKTGTIVPSEVAGKGEKNNKKKKKEPKRGSNLADIKDGCVVTKGGRGENWPVLEILTLGVGGNAPRISV